MNIKMNKITIMASQNTMITITIIKKAKALT